MGYDAGFLHSEHAPTLPFRAGYVDWRPSRRLHGKTGAADGYGWYVGWASRGARTVVFAHLLQKDSTQPQDVPAGVLAREALLAELPRLKVRASVGWRTAGQQ